MKQLFFIGIVSASILVASACARGQSNVYSVAIYSAGHSWADLCSLTLPFPPYHYKLTEHGWREDANGLEIIDFNRRNEKGSVARRSLDVECGTNSFRIALEPANVKRAKADRISLGNSGSGDFALLVTSCITNRGGHTMAPNAASVRLIWVAHSAEFEDVIIVAGDHFAELQKFLEQTCGTPDGSIKSSASIANARSITYSPQQIGVMLNLVADSIQTVISVVGGRKL